MYNAFISYSHGADNIFAPALQTALQKFAKPWYKKRNLEIFQDESNLAVSPLLWNNITRALDASEFLILLASPASEKSKWVNKEVEYWLQHRSIDTILFALTEGNMDWDNEHNCFSDPDNNSLPPVLDKAFDSEPFYIDMRQARMAKDLSLDNPIFKKEVLKLAAKLHGLQPNDMASEEVTAHRKMIRTRNTAFGLLLSLLITALGAGLIANQQKNKAIELAGSNTKLAKATKSVYFYSERFALSTNGLLFYFTDRNGDKVEKLGEWEGAEQFNYTGYARVKKMKLEHSILDSGFNFDSRRDDYILDTFGNTYRSAYEVQNIDSGVIVLDLADKHLKDLPVTMFAKTHLEILLLANNNLVSIPAGIGRLKNLIKLNVAKNKLEHLPASIGKLKKLETLDLRSNKLAYLPAEIGQLTNLKELHLFMTLQLLTIQGFDFDPTLLDSVPKEIGQLTNLTMLDMAISDEAILPREIGQLKKLETLLLFGEGNNLPDEIWQLKNLRTLFLHDFKLNSLPAAIETLGQLEMLVLNTVNLVALPKELGQLKNLKGLMLQNGRLTTLPKEIGSLKKLFVINLSGNQLTELPEEISELQELLIMILEGNQLATFPKELLNLKMLTGLNLGNNKLSTLPKEISNIKKLNHLNLKNNKLSALPKEIAELDSLVSLDLSINEFTTLPKVIRNLKNLKELDLSDNPLEEYEIEKLKKALPACTIKFSPRKPSY